MRNLRGAQLSAPAARSAPGPVRCLSIGKIVEAGVGRRHCTGPPAEAPALPPPGPPPKKKKKKLFLNAGFPRGAGRCTQLNGIEMHRSCPKARLKM